MKLIYRTTLSAVALAMVMGTSFALAGEGLVTLAEADASAAPAPAPAAATPAPATAEAKPKGLTLSEILGNSGIDTKGYLDMSYIDHSHGPNSSVQVFDTSKNSFGLHQAGITISKTPKEGLGGVLNLTAGSDAGIFCSYGECSSGNGATAGTGGNFDVTQAYAQYATSSWTLLGGKFITLAGAEVIDSSADTNITRSILFGKIPFTHTGVRATDAVSDTTSLIMGVNNGWDQVTGMTASKTLELGITNAFTKDTSLAVSGYFGAESMPNTPGFAATVNGRTGNRSLLDAVFTSNLTDALTLILNGDYVTQEHAMLAAGTSGTEKYQGLAGYLNYQFNEQYRVSFRAEALKDDYGIAVGSQPGLSNNVKEATLTVGYAPLKNFEMRAELRTDKSDQPVFYDAMGNMTQTNMTTIGIQGIYKF